MILTTQSPGRTAVVTDHRGPAVLAGVVKASDDAIGPAHDQKGHAEVVEGHVVPGFGYVFHASGDYPSLGPEVVLLEIMELLASVAVGWNVMERRKPLGWRRPLELVGHIQSDSFDELLVHGCSVRVRYRCVGVQSLHVSPITNNPLSFSHRRRLPRTQPVAVAGKHVGQHPPKSRKGGRRYDRSDRHVDHRY